MQRIHISTIVVLRRTTLLVGTRPCIRICHSNFDAEYEGMQHRAEPHVIVRVFRIGEFRALARKRAPYGQLRTQLARRWSGHGRGKAIGGD
jgi:hypothetical protein